MLSKRASGDYSTRAEADLKPVESIVSMQPVMAKETGLRWAVRRGVAATEGDYLCPKRASLRAFSLVETVVVIMLVSILVVAGLSTLTLLDRSSRRQALHTTALELAQGNIEALMAQRYNPP